MYISLVHEILQENEFLVLALCCKTVQEERTTGPVGYVTLVVQNVVSPQGISVPVGSSSYSLLRV